jgi:hypothetical protein
VAAEEDEDEDEDEEVAGVDEYVWTQETLQILEECQEETADELVTTRLALRNVCFSLSLSLSLSLSPSPSPSPSPSTETTL